MPRVILRTGDVARGGVQKKNQIFNLFYRSVYLFWERGNFIPKKKREFAGNSGNLKVKFVGWLGMGQFVILARMRSEGSRGGGVTRRN